MGKYACESNVTTKAIHKASLVKSFIFFIPYSPF